MHNKLLSEKWVNCFHFYNNEKNLQKVSVTVKILSDYSYYMINPSFQSQFVVLQFVKWWLTVVNVLLIVVSNYLITVKQGLTIFFFQKLCVIGKISIR